MTTATTTTGQARPVILDVRQLWVFCAVAENGSFSGAAKALHCAQPSVSYHIVRLEAQLGTVLFDRCRGRGHSPLTAAGLVLLPLARRLLEQVAWAEATFTAHIEVALTTVDRHTPTPHTTDMNQE